jgi:ariadne-1
MDLKTATDADFIGDANRMLVDCRRVLKYTYAHAFTSDDDDDTNKELLMVHIERLERFVEELSLESEGAITSEGRKKVMDLTNAVKKTKDAVEDSIAYR